MRAAIRTGENPPPTALRTAFFVAVAVVAVFVILEYVYDWPIHFAH